MTRPEDKAQSKTHGETGQSSIDGQMSAARHLNDKSTMMPTQRDPVNTLRGCQRIVILGRTGSGKTTLARELATAIGVPHVELDALYFGPGFSTAPLSVLRERTSAAIAGDRWVTDGNKSAVRDLVWPRADTVIWLDYPSVVSLWRLGKRALWRTSVLKVQAAKRGGEAGLFKQFFLAAKGYLQRSDHTGASVVNIPGCSPGKRISTSRLCAFGPHVLLAAGWLAYLGMRHQLRLRRGSVGGGLAVSAIVQEAERNYLEITCRGTSTICGCATPF